LVGGTALALQIGHRRSVDFGLFTLRSFDIERIRNTVRQKFAIQETLVENPNELTLAINNVKLTFYKYPYTMGFQKA